MPEFDIATVVKLAAKEGAKAAMEKEKEEREKREKEWYDRRIHNMKQLLQNYREFKTCAKNSVYNALQADEIISISDLMWDPHNRGEVEVGEIKKNAVRTNIMMVHLDSMLDYYRDLCENSKNPAELRRYSVIIDRYIAEEELTIEEIAKKNHVEPRTIYNDIDYATEKLAKLVFGIDILNKPKRKKGNS